MCILIWLWLNKGHGAGHGGSLNHVLVTFTDKIYPSDPLKREDYWR